MSAKQGEASTTIMTVREPRNCDIESDTPHNRPTDYTAALGEPLRDGSKLSQRGSFGLGVEHLSAKADCCLPSTNQSGVGGCVADAQFVGHLMERAIGEVIVH